MKLAQVSDGNLSPPPSPSSSSIIIIIILHHHHHSHPPSPLHRSSSWRCARLCLSLTDSSSSIHRIVSNTEFYPQTYTQAVCLCKGCIMSRNGTVIDNQDYNSAQVIGSWVFMKREKCKKGGYKLKPERRDVTMGCTCVRPSSSR
uniref:Uncharacterized protein n=1 Tax=Xiphophorus couchianus TaxID=32473 RepID=A0A3B5M3I7_9TELE